MSLAGKTPADTYKSLLKMSSDEDGITTSSSRVYDGNGQSSSILLSDDQFLVRPTSDNTTSNFAVADQSGTHYVNASGTEMVLKVGSTLTPANTQLLTFSAHTLTPATGSHYFIPTETGSFGGNHNELSNGTGADPSTGLYDASTSTDDLLHCLFTVPFNIIIDSVTAYISTTLTNNVTANIHLLSYSLMNAGNNFDGNLSSGAIIAAGSATEAKNSVIKQINCSITGTATISSGKVLACFIENETNTDPLMVKVQVVYHIA